MNDRQKNFLDLVIKEHIKTAAPIGSSLLVDKTSEKVSSATVRNDLAALEKDGYIYQPHTSAGRVPTEKGYRYYIDNFLQKKEIKSTLTKSFKQVLAKNIETDDVLKNMAKLVVEAADEAVIVAFDKNNLYYTGLSSLFSKPEFGSQDTICNLSGILDHLDTVVEKVFDQVKNVEILIGKDNPFGSDCSAILGKYTLKDKKDGMFIILGPMRMNYDRNIALIESVKKSLEEI